MEDVDLIRERKYGERCSQEHQLSGPSGKNLGLRSLLPL